ncbi:hypothetical protein [Aquimarina litoralis]|uniref:hypothetical protein n=1 Tax=Aquimarina litoralis TaxID=584605 RepID=UPI001C568B47|nr:hypothetical protein [Aquimarina litoralis]MBW1297613.1 hypothetical protein [Aquimarina litoralis]
MKKTLTFVLLAFLFCLNGKAQSPVEGGYIELTKKEYEDFLNPEEENELNGKYYVREFKDKKLIAIHKIEYLKGKKHGEWVHFLVFRKKGTLDLSTIENYEDNERNGYYYNSDNGFTFTEEGYYEKGLKVGLWNVSKGGSNEKINYKNGKKHGDYWRQDASGVIVKGAYKKGKKLDNWTIEDLAGNTKTVQDPKIPTQIPNTLPVAGGLKTIKGDVKKPDGSVVPIAVIKLQISDTSCAYAFSDYDGKFNLEIDTSKITNGSYFEIVIEGFPKKVISYSDFSDQNTIVLENGRAKVSYEEYRSYYESMKDCQ